MGETERAFWVLLQGGLWEKKKKLSSSEHIDFNKVYRLSEEQSVIGLVTAGLDYVTDVSLPKEVVLQFVGYALQLEQRNQAMNSFVAEWVGKLRYGKMNPILIKGQGIAQCYEKPLWRTCGDVDFLLSASDYETSKYLLMPYVQTEPKETIESKEFCSMIDNWTIELHGSLHCRLTKRLDSFLDKIQSECTETGRVRVWKYDNTDVFLPSVDNDILVIFTHIVKHFFREGVGLRQVCDLCRLLWTYKTEIDHIVLKKRLKEGGIMTEWLAFAAFGVKYLGIPVEAMPLYSASRKWNRKAKKIKRLILETGSFGHNRDLSYSEKYPVLVVKMISLCRHTWELLRQFFVFPLDSIRVWCSMVSIGINAMNEGKNDGV